MRMVVLSRLAALYSTSRLVRAGRARGHDVDVVDPLELQVGVGTSPKGVLYRGERLRRYGAVIPRIGTSVTRYGVAVMRALESRRGIAVLNDSAAIAVSRDRLGSLARLAEKRVPVPRTVALHAAVGLDEAVAMVGGCPAVVKLHQGTQGVGTMLVESRAALAGIAETLWAMGHEILLQEMIRDTRGIDIRAFVVGGKVVAAMERRAERGEFRANLHLGASAKGITLDRAYARCARTASRVMGLEIAGVDMLRTPRGPVVLEVNASPGLEGIEEATGVDVAKAIVSRAERLARKRK
jgi:ribosomal protein S6--L-glutamate ligase